MFKTILVPIDMAHVAEGKANIDIAAQHAAAGAKIILLNVVEEIPGWAAAELPSNLIPDFPVAREGRVRCHRKSNRTRAGSRGA